MQIAVLRPRGQSDIYYEDLAKRSLAYRGKFSYLVSG